MSPKLSRTSNFLCSSVSTVKDKKPSTVVQCENRSPRISNQMAMEIVLIKKVVAETTVVETAVAEVTPLLKIIVKTTAKNSSRAGTTETETTRTGATATKKVARKQFSTEKATPEDLAMDITASEKFWPKVS